MRDWRCGKWVASLTLAVHWSRSPCYCLSGVLSLRQLRSVAKAARVPFCQPLDCARVAVSPHFDSRSRELDMVRWLLVHASICWLVAQCVGWWLVKGSRFRADVLLAGCWHRGFPHWTHVGSSRPLGVSDTSTASPCASPLPPRNPMSTTSDPPAPPDPSRAALLLPWLGAAALPLVLVLPVPLQSRRTCLSQHPSYRPSLPREPLPALWLRRPRMCLKWPRR